MRRLTLLAAAVVCVTSAIAACVIGPKQDDPAAPTQLGSDTGVIDVGAYEDEDTADPAAATEGGTDTSPGLVADAAPDAAGDACPDGGVPLTAMGPWNGGKNCWKGTRIFECVSGIDGGLVITCFVEISTGDLYQTGSTHLPSGSDFRVCNEAERARVGSSSDLCK